MNDQLCEYFKNCAYACSVEDFDRNFSKMRNVGRDIYDSFLDDLPKEHYSIIHFRGNQWDELSNTTAESFNSMTFEERQIPILDLIESIRGG